MWDAGRCGWPESTHAGSKGGKCSPGMVLGADPPFSPNPFDLAPPLAAQFPLLLWSHCRASKCEQSRGCNPCNASGKGASSHRQESVDASISATGWTQPSPLRAPLLLTHKGPPGKSYQQRHHNAGRLEPSLDAGCPRLVCAGEVKCLDEPAEGRNGKDCSRQSSPDLEEPRCPAPSGTPP